MGNYFKEMFKDDLNKAREEGKIEAIKNLMDSCKWSVEQAMAALKIPESDYHKYMAML